MSHPVRQITESISLLLEERPAGIAPEVLASEYARCCREVNERLERIAVMLEGGGEIQALQVAEQAPRLMDLAVELSFGGEVAWQEYCQEHGHEVAALVDARGLESLQAVYEKGLSANHPLYRDYRSAVLARDDRKAHELVRIIARLNPADENAAKELKRLERKGLQAALGRVREALETGDDAALVRAMARVEEIGFEEDQGKLPEWRQAIIRRSEHARREAWQRMPGLVAEAAAELESGEWRQAAVKHGEYAALVEQHGAPPDPALAEQAAAVEAALEANRKEANRLARVAHLSAELAELANEVETRSITAPGLPHDYAAPRLDLLVKKGREVEELHGVLPDTLRARVAATGKQLAQVVERRRRKQRAKRVLAAAAGSLVLLAVSVSGFMAARAATHRKALAEMRGNGSSGGVRDLVRGIRGGESWLLRFPSLAAVVADCEQWLDTVDHNTAWTTGELDLLEKGRLGGFAELPSPALFARLREAEKLVSGLPVDVRGRLEPRLLVLRNEAERVLGARQTEADNEARKVLDEWSGPIGQLDLDQPSAAIARQIAGARSSLGPLLAMAAQPDPLLRLPPATATALQDLDAQLTKVEASLESLADALVALRNAPGCAEYHQALEQLAACGFREAVEGRKVLAAWPDEEHLRAHILFRGDLKAIKAARNVTAYYVPVPETTTELDRQTVRELRNEPMLNDIWDLEWIDKGARFSGFSIGEMTAQRNAGIAAKWSGKVAERPKLRGAAPRFVTRNFDAYYDQQVVLNKPSATSALMRALRLGELLDDSGISFRRSLIPSIELVTRDDKAPVLARAYLLDKLLRLVKNREVDWGLHYCPQLADDIEAFERIRNQWAVAAQDWMSPETPEMITPWKEYFASRGQRTYFQTLERMQSAARTGQAGAISLAGRVDESGQVHLSESTKRRLAWGIGPDQAGEHGLRVAGLIAAGSRGLSPLNRLAPFSPLLCLELPEADQDFLLDMHGHAPARPAPPNPAGP